MWPCFLSLSTMGACRVAVGTCRSSGSLSTMMRKSRFCARNCTLPVMSKYVFTGIAGPRDGRPGHDPSRGRNQAPDVAPHLGQAEHEPPAAGLANQMEAFELVALPERVQHHVHQVHLDEGLARQMGAGRAVHADPPNVDRSGPGQFREAVREADEPVGVAVFSLGRVFPVPTFPIDRAVAVAVQNHDRAGALTSGCGHIVADTEILVVDVEPQRLRFCGALFARHRDPAQRVFLVDDLRAGRIDAPAATASSIAASEPRTTLDHQALIEKVMRTRHPVPASFGWKSVAQVGDRAVTYVTPCRRTAAQGGSAAWVESTFAERTHHLHSARRASHVSSPQERGEGEERSIRADHLEHVFRLDLEIVAACGRRGRSGGPCAVW